MFQEFVSCPVGSVLLEQVEVSLGMESESQFLQKSLQKTEPPLVLSDTRILLVDDNEDARLLFGFVLEEHGAEVIAVGSVREAIAIAEQVKLHLLISDICLPDEDGYSLLHKIRSLKASQGEQIPALAVTGMAQDANGINNGLTGFQLQLTKPVEPDALLAAALFLIKQKLFV